MPDLKLQDFSSSSALFFGALDCQRKKLKNIDGVGFRASTQSTPFHSDASQHGGSNGGNMGGKHRSNGAYHHKPHSIDVCLPPLGVVVFKRDRTKKPAIAAHRV
ncbi:MAG: alpha amylase C-terminal domain-containing protein [Cyanobacteria bacterium P01_G01_bin.54]